MQSLCSSWFRQRLARNVACLWSEQSQRVSSALSTLAGSTIQSQPLLTRILPSLGSCNAESAHACSSQALRSEPGAASGHVLPAPAPGTQGFPTGAYIGAGALVLGTALSGQVADCKSQNGAGDPANGSGKPVGGEQADKVMSVWEGIEQETLRADAQLPQGCACAPLQAPQIKKAQGSLIVDVLVRQGVSLPHLEQAILTMQPGLNTESRHQTAKMQEDMSRKLVTISQGNRSISLSIPKVSQGEARISFWKQGDIDDSDMPLLGHIMSLANDLQLDKLALQASPFSGFGSMGAHSMDDLLMNPFGGADEIMQLFGAIKDQLESDQQLMGLGDVWANEGDHDQAVSPFLQIPSHPQRAQPRAPGKDSNLSWQQAAQQLRQLGALVYLPDDEEQKELDWSDMAGYDSQKRAVEDLVLMSVKHAEEYERVAKQTRKDGKHQRPKAVLLEGPPGTGKTHVVRIVSSQASIPLVYIPLESTASKWYGESEKTLSSMLNLAERMGGCIIFLDEVDSLATKRADDMNEATRRLLGVLLRFIDGFKATDSIVIGATNRQQDLDTALLSRCQSIVSFGLPDEQCRADILKHYAAHLKPQELNAIAKETQGMAARDLRAVCEEAERAWVSSIIRGQAKKGSLPPLAAYTAAAQARSSSLRMNV